MPKLADKNFKVKVSIQPGPASPAQKAAWRRFWAKLLAEVKASE